MSVDTGGLTQPRGDLALTVLRSRPMGELSFDDIDRYGRPQLHLPPEVNAWREENQPNLTRGLDKLLVARENRLSHLFGALWLDVIYEGGQRVGLGLASLRVVTTVGVGFIVDAFQNIVEVETMKYHGTGSGTNAEAAGDTALQTEFTTQTNPNSTRATGTTTEGASANIYRTVATNNYDATVVVTEHGIFSDPTVASGVLLDRSVFSAVNLISGDSLQTAYELTVAAGS